MKPHSGCVTGPRCVIVCSTWRSTSRAVQTKQNLCSTLCGGMEECEELTCLCVSESVCGARTDGVFGSAPSLAPLHVG